MKSVLRKIICTKLTNTITGDLESKLVCFVKFNCNNAIDVSNGITDSDWEVVQVKKAMIESSERVISLAISEKLNTTQRIKICEVNDIDVLITELDPGHDLLIPYHKAAIEILWLERETKKAKIIIFTI